MRHDARSRSRRRASAARRRPRLPRHIRCMRATACAVHTPAGPHSTLRQRAPRKRDCSHTAACHGCAAISRRRRSAAVSGRTFVVVAAAAATAAPPSAPLPPAPATATATSSRHSASRRMALTSITLRRCASSTRSTRDAKGGCTEEEAEAADRDDSAGR